MHEALPSDERCQDLPEQYVESATLMQIPGEKKIVVEPMLPQEDSEEEDVGESYKRDKDCLNISDERECDLHPMCVYTKRKFRKSSCGARPGVRQGEVYPGPMFKRQKVLPPQDLSKLKQLIQTINRKKLEEEEFVSEIKPLTTVEQTEYLKKIGVSPQPQKWWDTWESDRASPRDPEREKKIAELTSGSSVEQEAEAPAAPAAPPPALPARLIPVTITFVPGSIALLARAIPPARSIPHATSFLSVKTGDFEYCVFENLLPEPAFLGSHQRYGDPGHVSPAGPADAVDIGLALFGNIIIYNTRHRRDIKPSRSDIRRHQHLDISGAEFIHDAKTDILGLVTVQRTGAVIIAP